MENEEQTGLQTPQNKRNWRKYIKITLIVLAGILLATFLLILSLRWVNPSFTAFTLQEDWDDLGKDRYSLREYWVSSEEIPNHMKWAVLASEDQRFYQHNGLDLDAIETAIEEHEEGGDLRGASTITQQVAKNLFLSPAQSYFRKGIEAGLALTIEILWSKDRILEVYLNTSEFGPGMYGIGKATNELYAKAPSQLSPVESARLATVLPNPKKMRAEPPSPFVRKRSQWVLRQIRQLTGVNYNPPDPDTSKNLLVDRKPAEIDTSGFLADSLIDYRSTDSLQQSASGDSLENE